LKSGVRLFTFFFFRSVFFFINLATKFKKNKKNKKLSVTCGTQSLGGFSRIGRHGIGRHTMFSSGMLSDPNSIGGVTHIDDIMGSMLASSVADVVSSLVRSNQRL
jgi:hypothetical protein